LAETPRTAQAAAVDHLYSLREDLQLYLWPQAVVVEDATIAVLPLCIPALQEL
jgi:hypothetical protein